MKTIEIEEDIHQHLLHNTIDFGETPSTVLRRLLGLTVAPREEENEKKSEIDKIITSTDFIFARGVVGKFLVLLSELHKLDSTTFTRVEGIQGRGRVYFATDEDTLHKNGRSVNPKRIPNTKYWVITTTPTDLKQDIIERVMRLYKFSAGDISKAKSAITK